MQRHFFAIGALSAFAAVGAGAFGAHALRGILTPDLLEVFETAARYQMYHALALLAAAWAVSRQPSEARAQHPVVAGASASGPTSRPTSPARLTAAAAAGWLFVIGTVLFSGSLYALSLSGARWLGAVTPLGGLAWLGGWLALAVAGLKARD